MVVDPAERTGKKPGGATLEGMIWRANDILTCAVSSDSDGIPKDAFERCHGVMIISSVQVGLMFTNSVGSGIVLAKDQATGKWSLPCACSLSGLGVGLIVGGSHTGFIVFALDKATMDEFAGGNLFLSEEKLLADVGTFDRSGTLNLERNKGGALVVSFSKGAFVGGSVHGANITLKTTANYNFYGKAVTAEEILLYGSASPPLEMPEDKLTLIDEVYAKLDVMSNGGTVVPDVAEKQKVEDARKIAEKSLEEVKDDSDITRVDSLAE